MNDANREIRILIVDDDEEDFFITREYILNIPGKTFTIDWCYRYDEALDLICGERYDLYFVDYLLGKKTGLELIQDALENRCEEPIILLTGKGNQKVDIDAMKAGAFDYQIKPELSTEKLERCIRYALEKTAYLKALKTSERKFKNFFEKSKDAVFLTNQHMIFKEVNLGMVELFGFTEEELQGRTIYHLLVSDEAKKKLTHQIQKDGEINDEEMEFLTKGGNQISGILSLSTEKDKEGRAYMQGIIHDITNRRKAEVAKLQIEKLGAAGRLTRTLAHEIRNPLNNINLSVEQLTHDDKNGESRMFIDIINRNSHTINNLITQLLTSALPTETSLLPNSLEQIMDDAIGQAIDRIQLKKIELKVSYPESPSNILADANKLKIAFLNIIINSIEAMGGVRNEIAIRITESGQYYIVSIQDTGSGIDEENLSRLFEPYFTSKKNGMGLGLASTLNILQSHHAQAEVKSKIGQGTTFQIRFKKSTFPES